MTDTELDQILDDPSAKPLAHNRGFRYLLAANAVSQLGSQVSRVALPLVAVITLHATAFEVGVLVAGQTVGYLLIGLPAGVWIDRLPKRPVMIAADLIRAGFLLAVPISAMAGILALWQLYLAAAATGFALVMYDVAAQSSLPTLVGTTHLVEANVRLASVRTSAMLFGPAIAGWLIEIVSAASVILIDVVSYLLSAAFLFLGRVDEPRPANEKKMRLLADIREGWDFVVTQPILRWLAVANVMTNIFSSLFFAVQIPYLIRVIHLDPFQIGLIVTAGSIGGALGTIGSRPFIRRFGIENIAWGAAVCTWPLIVVLPLVQPGWSAWLYAGGWLIIAAGTQVNYMAQVILRQKVTPAPLLGRVSATLSFLMFGSMPLGALIGGIIAQQAGLRPAMWVAAAGIVVSLIPLLQIRRTVRSLAEDPVSAS